MKKREIELPIKLSHLRSITVVLICGMVFAASQMPIVRGFFGGTTGGGAANSYVSNAGHATRQPTNVASENLTAYYPFDGNANDQIVTGTVNLTAAGASGGTVSQAIGRVGSGVKFNANQDRLEAPSTATADYGSNISSFTFAAWVYLTSTTNDPVIISRYGGDSNGQREYYLSCDTGCTNIRWSVYNSANGATTVTKAFGGLNTWHHVVASYSVTDATSATLSLDVDNSGSPATASATLASQSATSTSRLMIGNYIALTSGQFYWKGTIDSVGHWNRILSTEEQNQLYNGSGSNGSGRSYSSLPGGIKIGLQNWWDLEESGTNTRIDSVKRGNNNGTLTVAPAVVDGKFGKAYSFNGSTQYITLASDVDATDITLSAWVKSANSSVCSAIAGKGDGNSPSTTDWIFTLGYLSSCGQAGLALFAAGAWNALAYTPGFQLDTWYHVAATFNDSANAVELFVNGVSLGTVTNNSSIYAGSEAPRIGRQGTNTTSNYMNGTIDDLRIYNTALTATQIASLYDASSPPNCDQSCEAWWKMDETSGTLADSSGKGRTGTNSGATAGAEGIYRNSYTFNGSTSTITTGVKFVDVNGNFTVSAWIYPTTLNGSAATIYGVVSEDNTSENKAWSLYVLGDGKLVYGQYSSLAGNPLSSPAGQIKINNWYHVAVTRTPSTVAMYINGQPVTLSPNSTPTNIDGGGLGSPTFRIGVWRTDEFAGRIDDVRVYNRALSSSAVYEQYLAGRP